MGSGILGLGSMDNNLLVHCRDGALYFMNITDGLKVGKSLRCGGYSFCRLSTINYQKRNLGVLPSLRTSDALDIWDLDTMQLIIDKVSSLTTEKNGMMWGSV